MCQYEKRCHPRGEVSRVRIEHLLVVIALVRSTFPAYKACLEI